MTGSLDRARRHGGDRSHALGGPRTSGGKARSARNATVHGLSLPVLADPATAVEVEALMRQMPLAADAEIGELARVVAQAQVDLVRVRRARHGLIAATFTYLANSAEEVVANARASPFRLPDLTVQLASMDRYERRALSRRKFAIRAFNAARPRHVADIP
jgi:hypothetical protein